jgi:hypothetical protein
VTGSHKGYGGKWGAVRSEEARAIQDVMSRLVRLPVTMPEEAEKHLIEAGAHLLKALEIVIRFDLEEVQ